MGAGASIGSYQTAIDQCVSVLKDKDQIKELWSEIDFNGNGYVSLAEIDKVTFSVHVSRAVLFAYKKILQQNTYDTPTHTWMNCLTDGSSTGSNWQGLIQKF